MPYTSSGNADSGVIPVLDQNAPTPGPSGANDPVSKPDFITQLQQRLADIRNELSDLMNARYGELAVGPMASKASVNSLQKQAENDLKRDRLEEEESAVCSQLNNFLYTGTLGDYDASSEEGDAEDTGD